MGYDKTFKNFFLESESIIKKEEPSMAKNWEIVTDTGNVMMNKEILIADAPERFILFSGNKIC